MAGLLDPTRLLFDLQQGNEIAQRFSGCFDPVEIARRVTEGLVETFNCAFARLWLLEPDGTTLKLVASSGMYTHTDGFFGRVSLGAYKVGKIAQNRVSFLSNNLPAEPWVGNREWAIANEIRGFAGYPLVIQDRVIGVLATFSHHAMEPEFLEVLQTLCTMVAIALDTALHYQQEKQTWRMVTHATPLSRLSLSDQLVSIFSTTRLTLVGTEQPLSLPISYVFLQAGDLLNNAGCTYCRLIYTNDSVALEAIVPTIATIHDPQRWCESILGQLSFIVACLGGVLHTQMSGHQRAIQVGLTLPYAPVPSGHGVRIRCRLPMVQLALMHLVCLAGYRVCSDLGDATLPLITDDVTQIQSTERVVWVQHGHQPVPKGVRVKVDLSLHPEQLQQALEAACAGRSWGLEPQTSLQPLSDRELEIMRLLAQGLRDRDIADRLIISESTVKFHMNNVLTKLKARTRCQAIYQAIASGLLS